jgi:choline dehydrogenase-like flavoprotein
MEAPLATVASKPQFRNELLCRICEGLTCNCASRLLVSLTGCNSDVQANPKQSNVEVVNIQLTRGVEFCPGDAPSLIRRSAITTMRRRNFVKAMDDGPSPTELYAHFINVAHSATSARQRSKKYDPNPHGYSIHELGTCRMGDNPKTSVLNQWSQSHDVKNLFVVDGSSFVSSRWQNPTMTTVALAMRASDYLAEQMRQGNV